MDLDPRTTWEDRQKFLIAINQAIEEKLDGFDELTPALIRQIALEVAEELNLNVVTVQ